MEPSIALGLVVLAFLGAPLFAVFGAAALILFGQEGSTVGLTIDVFGDRFADSPTLVTLPLFTFAGYLMAESGTPRRLVRVSRALFGWLPGGLAIVCLCASAFFTTFTGGSGITIVAIGGLLFPALIEEKYPEKFSLGLVTTGGSLGLLFPPSIPIVLYAVVSGILIDKLFLAGAVPGTLTVFILAVYSFVVGSRRRPPRAEAIAGFKQFTRFVAGLVVGAIPTILLVLWLAGRQSTSTGADSALRLLFLPALLIAFFAATFATSGETRKALLEGAWELLLPVVLVVGLVTGVLRIHEASAFTALYVLIVEVFVYKDISLRKDLPRVIRESMTMLGAILAILATALGFTAYMIHARVPDLLVEWMETFVSSPFMFLLVLNVFLLVVGMLMDIFSAIVVVVPLIVPVARHFGIDDYHLGIVFLLNLEIGYLTPPVGLNLFISSFRFNQPVPKLYGAVLPFIGLLIVALAVTTYVPSLSTALASLISTDDLDAGRDAAPPDGLDEPFDDLGGGEPFDLGGDEPFDDLGGELEDVGLDDFEAGEPLAPAEPEPAEPMPTPAPAAQ